MANTIKIKSGSGTPTTSDIVDKELAFDRDANKLYINDSGTIVDLSGSASLDTEAVQDIVGGMFTSNTETRISATYQDGDGTIDLVVDDMTADTNTQLSTEQVQDIVGAMFSGNTETRITATYQDSDGTIDLVVDDLDTDTQLTTENVQDIVGAMFSSNTETRISASYQDGDGTIDLVVDDMTANDNTVTTNIAGTGINVSSGTGNSTISVDVSDFMTNGSNNRVLTATGTDGINAESSLLFSGSTLEINNTGDFSFIKNNTNSGGLRFGTKDAGGTYANQIEISNTGNYVKLNENTTITGSLTVNGTVGGTGVKDENDMSSNSASHLATQQSIKAYVDAEVAGIVNSAPSALNTLDELAAALGDDANFATTTSTSLGNRLRVDTASQGLNGTQQANAITNLGITATKAELNFVDGVTSNIQTQLNGKQASGSYLTSVPNHSANLLTSGTVPLARLNIPSSGNWFSGGSSIVATDGVMEIGRYIDFHNSDTTTDDFHIRLDCESTSVLNVQGGTLEVGGSQVLTASSSLNGSNISSGTVAAARIANLGASKITSGTFDAARIPTIDISSKTNLSAGTNITLSGDTLNVDDAFLKNNANDTTSGTITAAGFTTSGDVESTGGFTADGNARSYTWRAVNNTSSTSTTWAKIARVSGTQSTRFSIHLSGRASSFADGQLGAYGYIIGQLNNDDNYDILYYDHSNSSSSVVQEVAQVDVSGTQTDVYIKVGAFAEVVANAIISDGSIEVKSDTVTSQPANYVVASTVESWNSGNDGGGSGLDADKLDGLQASSFARSDTATSLTGRVTITDGGADGLLINNDTGNSADSARIFFEGTSTTALMQQGNDFSIRSGATTGSSSGTERVSINATGLRIHSGSLGVAVAGSSTDGRIDASNDVVAFSTSDKRLKENIKPLDSALDKVLQINGVSFDWKKLTEKEKKTIHGNQGHDVGVIAQEVEEVLPEVVQTRDNGYKAVKYEKIVPLLIESIKELKAEIEELKK